MMVTANEASLAVPAEIKWAEGCDAVVEIDGKRKRIDISLVEGVREGQYVLVAGGIAVQVLDAEETEQLLGADN